MKKGRSVRPFFMDRNPQPERDRSQSISHALEHEAQPHAFRDFIAVERCGAYRPRFVGP